MLLELALVAGHPIMCVKFEETGQNLRKTSERKACSFTPFIKV